MKRNILYILLPLATAATIFSFCTKEPQLSAVGNTQTDAVSVDDRANCKCTVDVLSGSVSICGTNTDPFQCSTSFQNVAIFGTAVLAAPQQGQYTVADTPSSIKFTGLNGATVPIVRVTTPGGTVTFGLAVGQTKEVYLDDNTCEPHVL